MRCFITGVAGFVGSHLAERLLADGHEVCGIDSFTDDYERSLKEWNLEGPRSWNRFHFIEGDLVEVALQPLLEGVDWIFHQAGQEKGRDDWASAFTHCTESNVLITLRLLEAALRFGWVRRFVYASSSSVYGKAAHLPIHEDELERPRSPNGVTKLAAESLCSLYHRRFGLPTVSLRYFSVYGPRQRPDMAFHRFCKAIVCHEPLNLYGGGYQTRDFIYVEDVVEANLRAAAASDVTGQVMNIGSGTSVTLRSVIELLEEISGSRLNVVVDDSQPDDVRHICADTQRAQQLLDYHPRMDLCDGLAYEFEFIHRLYERWPNLAARGALHLDSSNRLPEASGDPQAARKTAPTGLTAVPEPENSLLESQITELVADSMRRTESQMDTFTNREQQLQTPENSLNVPSDKEGEYVNLISSAKNTTAADLTGSPTFQTSQIDSNVTEPLADAVQRMEVADDYAVASKATAPNLVAVLEPEAREADSQTPQQVPQIYQVDSDVAESIADMVQRIEAVDDYATAANLVAVLEPEIREADSRVIESIVDTAQPTEVVDGYAVASKETAVNLTAVPKPETSQADSEVVESIADTVQRTEAPIDALDDTWQGQQTPQLHVDVPSDEEGEHVPISPAAFAEASQVPTSPWIPSSRLTRPAPVHAEQNHMGVAIITLLLVGLLILGGCLALYTQFIGSPLGVTTQQAVAPSAAITITTDGSKTLENSFSVVAVTDNPDAAQHQIKARQVVAKTQPVSKSVQVASASTSANDASNPTSSDQSTTPSVVQQSDIDAAANDLETANTPAAASILQSQLAPNEHLVGDPQCQPQVSADHKVGDVADSVNVTVVFSCSGETYNQGAAEKMAAQELTEQARKDIGSAYALSGQITTTVQDASISDASQGTITIPVDAHGTWVLQLDRNQQQVWANALAGKTKEAAQSFLLGQNGVNQADIQLRGGDGRTLPTDAKKITIKVRPIAGP